jgi:hypothetical protein
MRGEAGGAPVAATNDEHVRAKPNAMIAQLNQQRERSAHTMCMRCETQLPLRVFLGDAAE